jgi:hypothetical protein
MMLLSTLSDTLISAIVGGVLGIAGGIAGARVTLRGTRQESSRARESRRAGVVSLLKHELGTNLRVLNEWKRSKDRKNLPVRSNYLWDALKGEVPSLLTVEQVNHLATFYYVQAQFYKEPPQSDVQELIRHGLLALEALNAPDSQPS